MHVFNPDGRCLAIIPFEQILGIAIKQHYEADFELVGTFVEFKNIVDSQTVNVFNLPDKSSPEYSKSLEQAYQDWCFVNNKEPSEAKIKSAQGFILEVKTKQEDLLFLVAEEHLNLIEECIIDLNSITIFKITYENAI